MTSQPYYLPLADEVDVFRAAYAARLPVLLKVQPVAVKRALSNT